MTTIPDLRSSFADPKMMAALEMLGETAVRVALILERRASVEAEGAPFGGIAAAGIDRGGIDNAK